MKKLNWQKLNNNLYSFLKKHEHKLETISIIGLTLFLIPALVSNTALFKINNTPMDILGRNILAIIRLLDYGILASKIVIDIYMRKINRIKVILCFALSIIIIYTSKDLTIFKLFLVLFAVNDLKILQIAKCYAVNQFVILLLTICIASFGIIDNQLMDIERMRFSLGFDWVTLAPILLFFILCNIILYLNRNLTKLEFVLLMLIEFLLFILTNTRFAFIVSILIIIFGLICHENKVLKRLIQNKIIKKILILSPYICTLLSIILGYFYSNTNNLLQIANSLLSDRLSLIKSAIDTYGFSLFGKKIEWFGYGIGAVEGTYNFVDNSYMNILFNYGFIVLILVLFMYSYILFGALKTNNNKLVYVITLIILFSFTEPYLINIIFNPILLFIIPIYIEHKNLNM